MDINWDLAPEGAVELRCANNDLMRWFNLKGERYVSNQWCVDYAMEWQTIATRPTEKKTVADAWEAFSGKWPEDEPDDFVCVWNGERERFEFWISGYQPLDDSYLVCTRKEFEAYGKKQEAILPPLSQSLLDEAEQNNEKWTHRTNSGELCNIRVKEPDVNGLIIVTNERGEYLHHNCGSLKPIKPTLTKCEQEKIAQFIARVWNKSNPDLRAEFDAFCNDHDITD